MKEFVILLAGQKGRIVSTVIAIVLALATWLFTRFQWELTPELQAAITTAVGALVGWILDNIAARYSANGVADIQRAMQTTGRLVIVDGAAGEQTVTAAHALATKVLAGRK